LVSDMKLNTFFILLSFLALAGCGSFEDERGTLLTSNQNKDLVNSFEISKDQAEHFQVTDAKVEEAKTSVKPVQVKEEKVTKKKDKLEKQVKAKQPIAIEEKTKVAPATIVSDSSYPSDYPQELKDYDLKSKALYEQARHIFYQGEQSIMAISYLGVTAGYITITSKNLVKLGEKVAYHYFARFKSKDAYRYFYWLDDSIETFIEKSSLLPIKYSLFQREKKQNVDDLQLFDFKKLKTFHWYKRVKEGNNKDEKIENYIPRFTQDSFSALQFVRGLPMKKNDHYEFPVSTRGRAWLLTADVIGEETITIMNKEIKSIKLRCETHFPGVLQKSGDINFWYSADESRRLLKFQAKVKIGSINGELVEYAPGTPVK
jgi:hypothetical protein